MSMGGCCPKRDTFGSLASWKRRGVRGHHQLAPSNGTLSAPKKVGARGSPQRLGLARDAADSL